MRTLPSKKVCERFLLTYELQGAQKAVNLLARYYRIRAPKIVLNGRKVGNGDEACYDHDSYIAYFSKKGLNRSNVLHEFFHHLVAKGVVEINEEYEEKVADRFAEEIMARTKH